jgi:hypothetical protein
MATAGLVALCEGIVTALNGAGAGTFSEDFTAVFAFNPNYSNIDAKTLRVVVTDAGGDLELIGRGALGVTDNARVVVLWNVGTGATGIDTDRVGRALTLLEEITVFLATLGVAGYAPSGTMERASGDKEKSHYMPGNLEDRLFAASVKIEYQSRLPLRSGFSS